MFIIPMISMSLSFFAGIVELILLIPNGLFWLITGKFYAGRIHKYFYEKTILFNGAK